MTEFNFDPIGKAIIELREFGDVADIVDDRVRGFEPAPGDSNTPYRAFIVLSLLAAPPDPRLPIQRARIGAKLYGRTPQEAMALYVAAYHALHGVGPRVHANRLGIYTSHDDTGPSQGKDPGTDQPYVDAIFELVATTMAVA